MNLDDKIATECEVDHEFENNVRFFKDLNTGMLLDKYMTLNLSIV